MSLYMDWSAKRLAEELVNTCYWPHSTSGLSALDEATVAFGTKYPQVADAQRAFSQARIAHMRSWSTETRRYSDDAWDKVAEAAQRLADALRPLGNARVARCKERADWGTCNQPLTTDGTCCSQRYHIDPAEEVGTG